MKKNTILWLLALTPLFSFSQGVKANLYDKFLRKQRVETEDVPLEGLTGKTKLSMALTALDSTLYLTISGAGWGTTTVDIGDELRLLFSNDSVVTLKSTALQGFEPGMTQNSYRHQYLVAANQIEALTKYSLVGIRKYSFAAYTDLMIPQQNTAKLNKLSALFVETLKKTSLKLPRQINIRDIRNYIGDSVEFCSKVYKTRYFEGSDGGPTLLDVQANFSDPSVNVVILQKDRQKFNGAPENEYLNKDVCIRGIVTLRNNIPYLVVHDREQIKIKSPAELPEKESFAGNGSTVTAKNTLAAGQTVSLPEQPMAPPAAAEKMPQPVRKDAARHVKTRPVAEEKEYAETVRTGSKTTVTTKGVRYKVRGKAYFHNEPDESTRRSAFIIHWNNAILTPLDDKNGFIYNVFTNHLGQVSKGWLSKRDLIELR